VNGVNGRDTVFISSDQLKMVKATDFKFDMHVPRDSPDMTPLNFFENGAWPGR